MQSFDNLILNKAAVATLFAHQLKHWPKAAANYKALEGVVVKKIPFKGAEVAVQYNPSRIISSDAKIDVKTIEARQCFFCKQGRPKEQKAIPFKGETTDYVVQVNPFPIFPRHLVIPSLQHTRQELDSSRFADMLTLAKNLKDYIIFYNGPHSGASVPDHFHFQAGSRGLLPLEINYDSFDKEVLYERPTGENFMRVSVLKNYVRGAFVIEAATKKAAKEPMGRLYSLFSFYTKRGNGKFDPDAVVYSQKMHYDGRGNWEPRMNILCWWVPDDTPSGFWRIVVFCRGHLRPACYYAEGEANMTISTASVEMGGLIITPLEKDFKKIKTVDVENIYDYVTIEAELEKKLIRNMRTQPDVSVGILHSSQIKFTLNENYRLAEKDGIRSSHGKIYSGDNVISQTKDGRILFDGQTYHELLFECSEGVGTFWLRDVVIGVKFHWERKEDQKFSGKLKFIIDEGQLCAVDLVGVEDYLTSVISSEMSATASMQLLKAHAVISRSWLLAQMEKSTKENKAASLRQTDTELIKWYDREDHKNFDVCADDHCQRYQGLTRQSTEKVEQAIDSTWGEVLSYKGEICDARFYKCCGGVLEKFENVWDPTHYNYLVPVLDTEESMKKEVEIPDLTIEAEAEKWILSNPEAVCNTHDTKILSQVLNNYDQETTHFYRWKETLTQAEISKLVNEKSGIDFGEIVDLIPVERGSSGRLIKLKIVGTHKTMTIGKELEIRRLLSTSHLYSSAFVVRKYGNGPVPEKFELIGAGWGHGVGLCQIGAAVLGEKGYPYDAILYHYYPNSEIVKKY